MSDRRYGPDPSKDAEAADAAGREFAKVLACVTFCDLCATRKASCFGRRADGEVLKFACDECCDHVGDGVMCVAFDGDPNGELS